MSFHALERSIPRLAYQLKIRRDHKGILRVRRCGDFAEPLHFQRCFGNDQSVWRDGDWNGFVRVAKKVLLCHCAANFLLEDLVFYDSSASIKGDAFFFQESPLLCE